MTLQVRVAYESTKGHYKGGARRWQRSGKELCGRPQEIQAPGMHLSVLKLHLTKAPRASCVLLGYPDVRKKQKHVSFNNYALDVYYFWDLQN